MLLKFILILIHKTLSIEEMGHYTPALGICVMVMNQGLAMQGLAQLVMGKRRVSQLALHWRTWIFQYAYLGIKALMRAHENIFQDC